jgi:hypothetical protein
MFSQGRSAAIFHVVSRILERTVSVFRMLASVEALEGRKNLCAKFFGDCGAESDTVVSLREPRKNRLLLEPGCQCGRSLEGMQQRLIQFHPAAFEPVLGEATL